MRHLLFLLMLIVFNELKGQNLNDEPIIYEGVVTVDSISKKELALRARQWFSEHFTNVKDVLQISDLENGEVSGVGNFSCSVKYRAIGKDMIQLIPITAKIAIWTKDGKYKYQIGPFNMQGSQYYITRSDTFPDKSKYPRSIRTRMDDSYKQQKSQCELQAQQFIASLKKFLTGESQEKW